MHATNLDGAWTLTAVDAEGVAATLPRAIPATVPGCVHTDLLAAGLIEDPYLGDNEMKTSWIGHTRWSYARTFIWDGIGAPSAVNDLVFDGLDTVAEVRLNGVTLGTTANQHRTYRFRVTDTLRSGENELEVIFDSAWKYALDLEAALGSRPNAYPTPFNFIRKMSSNFGWDWGPQLTTAGIWKSVRLEEWADVRIASVRPSTSYGRDGAALRLVVEIERDGGTDNPVELCAHVAGLDYRVLMGAGHNCHDSGWIAVPTADAWWPRGMGEANLYPLDVSLNQADTAKDHWLGRIGFRTAALDTSEDAEGSAFTISVNGVPLFIRGANWIPDDCFPSRVDRERYGTRIEQACEANLNLLRVWGGGLYETDDFYELCDELGVMVWQDFLFACAAYPEEEPLRSEVIAEARDNISRIMAHPSLVLWNGCNENIWGWFDWDWQEPLQGRSWGLGYYLDVLPTLVAELDFSTPYWPGSPYSGAPQIYANDPERGNVHIWDVWNKVDYTVYSSYRPRFVSEFGFQGPPTWTTLTRSVSEAGLAKDSAEMLVHQKAEDGNGKLARGFTPHLPEPRSMEEWHYVTQLNQARAITHGIEHFRSLRGHCMGTIVWQLNDCWPVVSWSAVDGDGRRKPLWHALKEANRERLLRVERIGDGPVQLVAVNDALEPWEATVRATLRTLRGDVLAEAEVVVAVEALSSSTFDIPGSAMHTVGRDQMIVVERPDGIPLVWTSVEDIALELEDPRLTFEFGDWSEGVQRFWLRSSSLARGVILAVDRIDPESYVDLAGFDVVPGLPVQLVLRSPRPFTISDLSARGVVYTVNDLGADRLDRAPGLLSDAGRTS